MKCAVVTPVGPGHEYLALDAEESVEFARATARGVFSEILFIKVDDTRGETGRSAARNQGVALAQQAGADWVFFLDADDVMCPAAFANVAPHLAGYDAVWGAIYELADDEETGVIRSGQAMPITRIDELLGNDPFITLQMGHFVKTAAALATPFDPALDAGEDFDYYLRMWLRFSCVKIDLPFFFNRRHTYAGGPRAATDGDWRVAVERIICAKCVALDFHADFAWRGENFRFYVGDPFDPIHRCFLKRRFFEPDELAFVETWVKLAAAIVEVGAHVGNHVVYYARFMRPRKITVLEPNPQAVALLRRNLAANDVADADLSLLGIGASDISANYDFVRASSANRGAGRLVRAADGKVKCAPLDDLVCGQVDFIRIDVEGMELAVLAGAKRVIAGSRPKIMIEVSMPEIPRVEAWMALNHYAVKRRFDHEPAANFMLEPAGE